MLCAQHNTGLCADVNAYLMQQPCLHAQPSLLSAGPDLGSCLVQDPCHDLAWILDAAIAHSRESVDQGVLKPAHMASLKKFFHDLGADRVCSHSNPCSWQMLSHQSSGRVGWHPLLQLTHVHSTDLSSQEPCGCMKVKAAMWAKLTNSPQRSQTIPLLRDSLSVESLIHLFS